MSILKKIFFASVFFFSISLLFWGVYSLSFKKNSEVTTGKPDETIPLSKPIKEDPRKIIPPIFAEKISVVLEENVISPVILNSNRLRYFSKDTGEAFEADFDGTAKKVLSSKNPGLVNAFWSLEKNKAILKIKEPDGSFAFYFYDFTDHYKQALNKNIEDIAWQTNSDRIFYVYFNPENRKRTLNVSDPDGKNWIKLVDIPYEKISFYQIPKTGLISFWNSGNAYNQTIFQSVPMAGGEIRNLDKIGFGSDYLWDFSGNHFLVSHSDAQGGHKVELGIANYNGGEFRNLGLPTFVSKCAWSKDNETFYYALPGEIPDNAILPNDYKEGKFSTADTFWKINIKTGKKDRLLEAKEIKEKYDVSKMFLSSNEDFLFFLNKIDGKLYRIVL